MRVIQIVPVLVILTATVLVASIFAFSVVSSVDAKLPTEELKAITLFVEQVDIVLTSDLAVKGVVITAIDFPQPTKVELLTLQSGILTALGITDLNGIVTQIRIFVTDATITFNGVTHELKIPAEVVRFNGVVSVPDEDAVFQFDVVS